MIDKRVTDWSILTRLLLAADNLAWKAHAWAAEAARLALLPFEVCHMATRELRRLYGAHRPPANPEHARRRAHVRESVERAQRRRAVHASIIAKRNDPSWSERAN